MSCIVNFHPTLNSLLLGLYYLHHEHNPEIQLNGSVEASKNFVIYISSIVTALQTRTALLVQIRRLEGQYTISEQQ